jgi:hypothetical protein
MALIVEEGGKLLGTLSFPGASTVEGRVRGPREDLGDRVGDTVAAKPVPAPEGPVVLTDLFELEGGGNVEHDQDLTEAVLVADDEGSDIVTIDLHGRAGTDHHLAHITAE